MLNWSYQCSSERMQKGSVRCQSSSRKKREVSQGVCVLRGQRQLEKGIFQDFRCLNFTSALLLSLPLNPN